MTIISQIWRGFYPFYLGVLFVYMWSCKNNHHDGLNATPPQPLTAPQIDSVLALYETKGAPLSSVGFYGKYPPRELSADLFILKEVLKEAQTGLYRYHSPKEIDSCFTAALNKTSDSLDYLQFITELGRLFNFIGCGHSGWSHHPDFYEFRNKHMKFFPVDLLVVDEKYFIRCDLSAENLPAFTEILSINGKEPAELTPLLKSCMPVDGSAAKDGRSELAMFFRMAYSNFIGSPDTFSVIARVPGEDSPRELVLSAISMSDIDSLNKSRCARETGDDAPLQLNFTGPGKTAVYTIRSFRNEVIESRDQQFTRFNDSVFAIVANEAVESLIIDLRGNTGGWTANGRDLFSYFTNDTVKYMTKVEVKKPGDYRFAPIIKSSAGYHDTMDMRVSEYGLYEWRNYPSLLAAPAPKNRYKGRVYILIDDMTNSCATAFSALMRTHTTAVFVGEETGGAQCGSNAMVMTVQLPYSGVMVYLSTAQYQYNVAEPSITRGVVPYYRVRKKISDLREGKDAGMEIVVNLIRANEKQQTDGTW